MNENIKNIFNRCGLPNDAILEIFNTGNGGLIDDWYINKFSIMLIKECVEVINNAFGDYINPEIAINAVKKHFEVYCE